MACALDVEVDVLQHWCPELGAHKELHQESGSQRWRADCPKCGAERAFWFWVAGRFIRWRLYCPCEKDAVQLVIAQKVPCVDPKYRGRHRVEVSEIVELAEDRSLRELALRVALLDLAGVSLRDACDRLGVSRAQRYRVVSQVRHRRRS